MNTKAEPRFLVDFMLGRLARWLRIFGYDAEYVREENRYQSILQSLRDDQVILTRDHHLSSKRARRLVLVRDDHLGQQLKQVMEETGIVLSAGRLFSRCTICNKANDLVVNKEDVRSEVPDYVFTTQDAFSRCPTCGRLYWKGSHWDLIHKDLSRAGIRIEK